MDGLPPTTAFDLQLASFPLGTGPGPEALYSSVLSATTACKYDGARVTDLEIIGTTETTIYLRWTEVNDVTHHPCASVPAWYRVKYAVSPMGTWADATIGCDPTIEGVQVGAEMRCLLTDLEPETTYDVQLMSFHQEDGVWTDALYSNLVTGVTVDSPGGIPGS